MAKPAKTAPPGVDPTSLVDAQPTKDLFIEMLVKDITLIPAIEDLVDNSVDGARALRVGTKAQNRYEGLHIRIEADKKHFKISDDCGGIPIDIARNYAFRFGRPKEMPRTPHSVGQFGVGMKRALFKLGTKFSIESTAERSWFKLDVDVDEWRQKKEWQFVLTDHRDNQAQDPAKRGTTILLSDLHESVAEQLALENFQTELVKELEDAHQESLDSRLTITLNGIPLRTRPLTLLQADELKPAVFSRTIPVKGKGDVHVRIYAGVGKSDPVAAGWYVFCNGRLIVSADQSAVTGWGDTAEKGIPRFHPQFSRFRGFVFFDADEPLLLPWNTMKTGIDTDSPRFRAIRLDMTRLMRPVIDFLNKLDREKDKYPEDDGPLLTLVRSANDVRLPELPHSDKFVSPKPTPVPKTKPEDALIKYTRPSDQIKIVKAAIGAKSNKDVGEKTFDYYLRTECDFDG